MRLFRRVRIKTEIRIDDHGPGYLIFVNNLDPKVNEYALFSEFQARFPSFKSAKMMKDPISGMLRGYGLVRFLDESDQQRALAEMQGVYFGNRPMRVSTATPKSKLGGAGDSDNRMPTPRFDHNEPYSNSIIRRQLEAENEAKFRSLDPYSDPATEACLSEADTYDNLFGPGGKVALMEWA
jgi:RNA recognition motif-containing protein